MDNNKNIQSNKFIFFAFAFEMKELHTLFMKFYQEFDVDQNLIFDFEEMMACFEVFSQEDMLGQSLMKKVIKSIRSNLVGGVMSLFKEGGGSSG